VRRVFPRDGWKLVCCGTGICFPLVSTGKTGGRARHLWTRQHRSIRCRIPRASSSGGGGLAEPFSSMAALLVISGVAFFLLARNSPRSVRPANFGAMLQLLSRERLTWVLSLFYFLTYGGFVAFSIYLPVLLKDQFGLEPADAGFRTARFCCTGDHRSQHIFKQRLQDLSR
jgi:hypothetical protein